VNGTYPGKKPIEEANARQRFSDQIDNVAKRLAGGASSTQRLTENELSDFS
jgi:hypothetical protein